MSLSRVNTKLEKLEDEMVRMKAEVHAEFSYSVKLIKDDLIRIENRIEPCEKKTDENKEEVFGSVTIKLDDFATKLQDCNQRDATPQWSDIVSREVDSKMATVATDMLTVQESLEKTKLLIQEQKDREQS